MDAKDLEAVERDILYIQGSLPNDSRIARAMRRITDQRHSLIAEVKRLTLSAKQWETTAKLHLTNQLDREADLKRKDEALKQIVAVCDPHNINAGNESRRIAQNALKSSEEAEP